MPEAPEEASEINVMASLVTNETITNTPTFYDITTSESGTTDPYYPPFDDVGIAVSATILLSFYVVGMFGNITTIVVIAKNPKLKTSFMYCIMSLCVSDLTSANISLILLYRRTWGFDDFSPLPYVFCNIYWAGDIMTNYVTALHILTFASLRFNSIQFPYTFKKVKLLHAKIIISCIWIFSFLVGFIPFFIFVGIEKRDRTDVIPESRWPVCDVKSYWYSSYTLYQMIAYPTLLLCPAVGVVSLCVLIAATVHSRSAKLNSSAKNARKKKKERQAVLQLALIVVSFLIGYIPFTAYEFWCVQHWDNTPYIRKVDYWFGMIYYIFLRFSECMNPIVYNLGSTKMRFYTKKLLINMVHCKTSEN